MLAAAPSAAPVVQRSADELWAKHGELIDPSIERFKIPIGEAATAGPPTARVTLVAFTDYQCPFCARADGTLQRLQERYGKELRLVLKHNPLPFHPQAAPAARAVLAAREQGEDKLWLLHKKLFANQTRLGDELYEQAAQELGLDGKRWKADLVSQRARYDALIQADQAQARRVGAIGTPTFFINGRVLSGAQPEASFASLIDDELQRARRLEQAGVPTDKLYAVLQHGAREDKPAPPPPRPQLPDPAIVYRVPVGSAPVRGPAAAKVTIIEYADFECPFCSRASATLERLREQFSDDVRFAFKQMPLSFHPHAELAALAAVAAHEQGRFWAMHDKLFANQSALDRAALEGYARELGLNLGKFRAALDGVRTRKRVDADVAEAQGFGVRGTPTFFINGKPLNGAQPYESFEQVVRSEIDRADLKLRAGVAPGRLYEELIKEGRDHVPPPPPSAAEQVVYRVPLGDAPVRGPKDAKVTLVMWTDFQCPFCSRASSTVSELLKLYPRDLRVVIKQMPLSFHDKARTAAEAALAAHAQGRFFAYHDRLFANQDTLDRESLGRHAQELGLDPARFSAALDGGKHRAQVDAEVAEGTRLGVNGTPTFFINGRVLSGAQPITRFRARIDEAKREAEAMMKKKRIPAGRIYAEILADKDSRDQAPPPEPAEDAEDGEGPEGNDLKVYKVTPGDGPSLGPKDAPVTVVLFSDFQCPFCSRVVPTVKRIQARFGAKVRVVFRNYPLPFHRDARLAAEAALAAHAQGRFWAMHDKLFENQGALGRAALEGYARELGLDLARFNADLDGGRHRAAVQADIDYANTLPGGGFGTPTFYINGRKLAGAYPYERFEALINQALQAPARATP